MTTIKTVIRNRRVEAPAPDELPDGTEVELIINAKPMLPFGIEFMTEAEQGDDPQSIQQWREALHSLPSVPDELKRECEPTTWDEQMRQFNLEAMRKQFMEKTP